MPFALGTDAPIWSYPPFVHAFADAFLEPQPTKGQTPPLPDPVESGGKETDKEKASRLGTKNLTAFPLQPTIDFVAKILNNVHGLIPKALDGVLDGSEEAVNIRRVRPNRTTREERRQSTAVHHASSL